MRNRNSIAEVRRKLGLPPAEEVESLRLLRSFIKLRPRQRRDVLKLIERLALDASAAPECPQV